MRYNDIVRLSNTISKVFVAAGEAIRGIWSRTNFTRSLFVNQGLYGGHGLGFKEMQAPVKKKFKTCIQFAICIYLFPPSFPSFFLPSLLSYLVFPFLLFPYLLCCSFLPFLSICNKNSIPYILTSWLALRCEALYSFIFIFIQL